MAWLCYKINKWFCQAETNKKDNLFVFSDAFKDEVERKLHSVRKALAWQSEIDLPKMHFPSLEYLPNLKNQKTIPVAK